MSPRRNPNPSSPGTARLAEPMRRRQEAGAEALRARPGFGRALGRARGNGVLQGRVAKDLDTNRELLRRIQRRCEATLK